MKKILITGKNSYIGKNVKNWIMKEPDKYKVDSIDMKDESWVKLDFSEYDVVFHVAGIAHIKETKYNEELYYKVNRDLAYKTALKAKKSGVKQFIFLSSMSVYGIEKGIINKNTPIIPKNAYGKSKIEAERLISELEDSSFKLAILRPPMIYGNGCKGNYPKLAKISLKMPIFPDLYNERSMIYIGNLSEFIKQLIDNNSRGLFFPQNSKFVNTSQMVELIAKANKKKIFMTKVFNPLLLLLLNKINISIINKVFGTLVYDMSISKNRIDYNIYQFEESIKITEE